MGANVSMVPTHANNEDDVPERQMIRYQPEGLDALCRNSKFSRKELQTMYRGFKQDCPTGIVNEETFKKIYANFFPHGDSSAYAHFVFSTFDRDADDTISFEEIVMGLSILVRGSFHEKLQWAFGLYDINGDGFISKEEMYDIVSAIYDMMGRHAVPVIEEHTARAQNNVAHTEMEQAKRVQQFTEKAMSSFEKKDYRTVLFCMDRCIELSPDCRKFRLLKAECLALLKRYQESQEIANDMLRFDSMNVEALYVRGLCLYYQDSVDKAFSHFQQVLRLAPDHMKAKLCYRKAKLLVQKKEEGNAAFRAGRLQEAHGLYTEALAIDPDNIFTNSKLYCNRATVSSKTGKNEEAIKDCTTAIELDDTYLKAYMRRARSYMDSELYEEAVRDYEKIFKMDKTHANKQLLSQAKLELKKSKRKDYYKVLGVSKTAQEDEIKKAYRKRALLHHPDRHASATDEVKKNEEKKFKEIGEAYSVLSDPKKKSRYDSGQDLDDMEGPGFHHQDFDPNMIFQSFFGGGGGPSFGGASFGGPGGGGPGFSNFQGPGGFSFQFG